MRYKAYVLAVIFFASLLFSCKKQEVPPPSPYGAVPSASQLEWQKLEYYMFVHFGPNTFTDREWGDGKEDPKVFNPSDLDCRQWVATAKTAGMRGIIVTAKHHDGFCLWPSQYSTHTVRESAWKDGKGDVLKELSDACREFGLEFGVYLSPWDQNHPDYGTPQYNQVFANTLTEVLNGYGRVFEQWFDGANGEGKDGKKQIYDWELFNKTVLEHQPHAIIFSDIGPGCRWIGNEAGYAGETNWSRLDVEGFEPGRYSPPLDTLNQGNKFGAEWVPGETDVSIRPGWFYRPSTDDKVKSLEQLLDIYYASVGRNSNLLLNVPVDRRGLIHPNDSTRLMELRMAIDEIFKSNLAKKATISSSSTRGRSSQYDAKNMLDGNYDTYWATDDSVLSASVVLEFDQAQTFNRVVLQEYIPLGQRVAAFNIEYWNEQSKNWSLLSEATTIGYKRILKVPTTTSKKIKINLIKSLACPVLNNIELYTAPEELAAPVIVRNKQGMISIESQVDNVSIFYTTDGTEPTVESLKYKEAFSLPLGGIVKAVLVSDDGTKKSETITVRYDLAPTKWRVISPKTTEADKAIDGNFQISALINKSDALVVDLGENLLIKGFFYVPINSKSAPNISRYNFQVSIDGSKWTTALNNATFGNIKNNPIRQNSYFEKSIQVRFIKLEPLELTARSEVYAIEELGIITH